ncbi:MAG TPA: hypothetical protein VEP89_11215 [Draconibacterium sp.]|nr:hypothetical protein [Draconibacterium sp.]
MEEWAQFHFDPQTLIVHKKYFGEIDINKIKRSWDSFVYIGEIPDNYTGLIIDYRKAKIVAELTEYLKLVSYYKQHTEVFGDKRIAFVVQNPEDIVRTILFEKKSEGFNISNFSTIEAAEKWILS